jgi:hypothetical protein
MKRLLIGLTALVGLTTSSCALSILAATMPRDLIYESVICPTDGKIKAKNFQVLNTQRWADGVVVLYSALCPGADQRDQMQKVFGHKVVRRNGISWQTNGSGSYITDNGDNSGEAKPKKLLEYDISKFVGQNNDKKPGAESYTIVYGRTLEQKVAIVQATFNNGQILSDRPYNGVFALIAPGASGVCELRVLGSDNQILSQEDLLIPKKPSRVDKPEKAEQCLPVSHQL